LTAPGRQPSNTAVITAALVATAYLLGSVAAAIPIARVMGLPDPRSSGSGNPGATNVLRLGGKKAAVLTLVADIAKGVVAVLAVRALGMDSWVVALVAAAVFLGHLFPVYYGFRGGKGVATALGVVLALAWPVGLLLIVVWLAVAVSFRYSSLSALVAAAIAPAAMAWVSGEAAFVTVTATLSLLLIWRHRANIRRLIDGTESRISV
jgi:acyl phosphate:glycerol-3-phosphate acyltransferase